MFVIIFLILGILILVLETTFLQLLPAWLGKPDLLFLLIVYVACQADFFKGALVVLLLGLIMDSFSGVFLGLYPVIYLLVFAFIKGVSRQVAINQFAYQVPLAVICYLLVGVGMFLVSFFLAPESPPQWSWSAMLLQLLILAVIGTPVFGIFDSVSNFYHSSSASGRFLGTKRSNIFKQ
jgi:rod shape-determining protein MreD